MKWTRSRFARAAPGLLALFWSAPTLAQTEQDTSFRFSATAEKKLNKQFRVFVSPEMRTETWNPERYLLELGVKYRPIKYFQLTPAYRFGLRETNTDLITDQRVRLDAMGRLPLGDFDPSFRLRYSAGFRPDEETNHRLRYRLALDYKITKRLDAGVSAELFQSLTLGEVEKMRYGAGAEYEFHKNKKKKLSQSVLFEYRLDYFLTEYRNVHIFELGYVFSF